MEYKTMGLKTAIDELFKAIEPNTRTDELAGDIDEIIGKIDDELYNQDHKIGELKQEIAEMEPSTLFDREKEPFTYKNDVLQYIYQCFESMTMEDRQRFILLLLTGHQDDGTGQVINHKERDRVWELIREWDGRK